MEATSSRFVTMVENALHAASALIVAYAFSFVGAIIILVVGYLVAGVAERWCYKGLSHVHGFDQTLRIFLSKVLRYSILILVGISVLAQFGVQTASIIATLGAAGIAIGLALQGTLQNIAAGIMLLVLRPFTVGEYVSVDSTSGTIKEIGLFATELRTYDGLYVMAPNSKLWGSPVVNYSRNTTRLNDLAVGIGYGDDIDQAMKILLKMAEDSRVLKDPAPLAFVSSLGDSSVVVTLRYWTASSDWWRTKLDFTQNVKAQFDEQGISIPFPQRDVHHFGLEALSPAKKTEQTRS